MGTDEATVSKYFDELNQKNKHKLTAEDLMANFLPMGCKDRLKYESQNRKSTFSAGWGTADNKLASVTIHSECLPASDYATGIKEAWDLLAEIAITKLGPPSQPAKMPKMEEVPNSIASIPRWKMGNIEIYLRVAEFKSHNGPLYVVSLNAMETHLP